MAMYRMVRTDFWKIPMVMEEMSPEDKYFYLYLLTNPNTKQIGIYTITKKQMAFDLGYSMETVQALMDRFCFHHKLIRYNPETWELAIKEWGKYNLQKGGKPVMDCMYSELKEVVDTSLISYVMESINKQEFRELFESFCHVEPLEEEELDLEEEPLEPLVTCHSTIRGQKEKEKEKEKQKQQEKEKEKQIQKETEQNQNGEKNKHIHSPSQQKKNDVEDVVVFWDKNGFGFTNIHGKEQLLMWLDKDVFLQPKEVIIKAMEIACANNKRMLNYVIGILNNWKNLRLLTVREIDLHVEKQKNIKKQPPEAKVLPPGRDIPRNFIFDLTAGERE
jgi:DnaD/phage-associated family protein